MKKLGLNLRKSMLVVGTVFGVSWTVYQTYRMDDRIKGKLGKLKRRKLVKTRQLSR